MWYRPLAAAALLAALALPAAAQAPQGTPMNVRGTVESLSGPTLKMKTREGTEATFTLPANVPVSAVAMKTVADIKQGDFIGATTIVGTDGKPHALEIHIFPEAARGTGEGSRPYDLAPNSTMTNATVSGVASTAKDGHVTLKYPDGSISFEVDANTPVVAPIPGDISLLKPGAYIIVSVLKQADGSVTVRRVSAEKDGIRPPT